MPSDRLGRGVLDERAEEARHLDRRGRRLPPLVVGRVPRARHRLLQAVRRQDAEGHRDARSRPRPP